MHAQPWVFISIVLILQELKTRMSYPFECCWMNEIHQGWELAHSFIAHSLIRSFAHSLIAHSLICSFAHCSFAHLLISLKSNERLWAIRSDCSRQMSDHERIAQVAQRKWATVSESLRSLKTNEWPWAICSGRSEEMSEWAIRSKNFG